MAEHTSSMTPEFERRLRQSERALLALDLRQKYLRPHVPDGVAAKVFDKAWEDGHAEGTYTLEQHYDDLSEIANAAFRAGIAFVEDGKPNEYGFACAEFDENGSCVHSEHMQAAGL